MVQRLKKKWKEEKGFTLIELLAVIVILGIIAAIAIPSIIGIVNNSKKDAQIANAQQMVSSARTGIANGTFNTPTSTSSTTISLNDLISNGLMENPKDPTDNNGYNKGTSTVTVSVDSSDSQKLNYSVTLKGAGGTTHINGDPATLSKSAVTP